VYTLARFLQALGLVLVPYALFVGIRGHEAGQSGVAAMELAILAGAAALFLLGRWIEARATR
jgi:hypothetical protein